MSVLTLVPELMSVASFLIKGSQIIFISMLERLTIPNICTDLSYPPVLFSTCYFDFISQRLVTTLFSSYMISHTRFQVLSRSTAFQNSHWFFPCIPFHNCIGRNIRSFQSCFFLTGKSFVQQRYLRNVKLHLNTVLMLYEQHIL